VIGLSGLVSAPCAALLNGVAGAVNAFDDTHAEAVIHPGTPVGGALVALASGLDIRVPGDVFLTAYAWGVELACRLSKALSVAPARAPVGWSQTGIAAPAGAAAACSRLLGLDELRTAWAIGTAASLSSGLRVAHGSMAMHLVPGRAAAAGLEAALFAQAGLTGPDNALEGRYGFLELFAQEAAPQRLLADLGVRFELLANTFKPYPCGVVIHAVIDACLALSRMEAFAPADVRRLILEVPPATIALADRPDPDNVFAAQVSVQHWAAAALLQGQAGLEQGSPRAICDPVIRAIRSQCRLVRRTDLPSEGAIVTLELANDCRRTVAIEHCSGSLNNPLTDEALSSKFLAQAAAVLGETQARNLLARCWAIERDNDVRLLLRSTL
jgi:2-methylcitrate dehydratase PrpD